MMVNTSTFISTRSRILAILRSSDFPVSGETVASEIGVSRVSVWKGIQALNASGYRIVSSSGGYRLEADRKDSIYPWEFGADEDRFRHWEATDSTMDRAREAALAGSEAGLVVTAESQSAGRGNGTKKWESAAGGLFFTLITRPPLNASYSHRQVLAAQLALARAVGSLTGKTALPLWPNDILFDGGKAAGILAECLSSGGMVSWLNLGIGVNTGARPSLRGTSAIPAPRKDLLREFLARFEQIDTGDSMGSGLADTWNAACPLAGKTIRFRMLTPAGPKGAVQTGLFRGVDGAGWALMETSENNTVPAETRFPPNTITILDKGYES